MRWARTGTARERFSVPSRPLTGSDAISSGMTGLAQAASNNRLSNCALVRESRESPEPLSSTSAAAAGPSRAPAHCRTTSRAASGVPAPRRVAPSVRKSCCAITLLLYLLMSRTTSASAGETDSKLGGVAGAVPSRTLPPRRPPSSCHIPSSARAL